MNPINPAFSPYGYNPYNPMLTPQQRLAEMEQQYPQFANNQNQMNMNQNQQMQQSGMMQNQNFVKCRAVTSEDEARAATLNVYRLDVATEPQKQAETEQRQEIDLSVYVQQKDLESVCQTFNSQICDLEDRLRGYDKALQGLAEKQAKGGAKK